MVASLPHFGSKNEENVYRVLAQRRVRFKYQVPIRGGRNVRGGQVLDFLVYNPFEIPVQVFGEYWHAGSLDPEERLRLIILEQEFNRKPVVLWGDETDTLEETVSALERNNVI